MPYLISTKMIKINLMNNHQENNTTMEYKKIQEDWRVYQPNITRPSVITVSGNNGQTDIYSAPKTSCTVEKANLIAAAPDLYEVVRKALPLLKRSCYEISIDAEYALKKALGE